MPELNSQQLQEWYKEFSAILLTQADIDVTIPNSLGLVKNFEITKWDTTNAARPDIKITYAYADDSAPPYSDTERKATHSAWMDAHLKPAVTEAQIRKLYNMSREGTLMLSSPSAGIKDLRMVHTDPTGKVILSKPSSQYRKVGNENLPEEDRLPELPAGPTSSLNPEDYGIRPRPTEPQAPANMHPGFFSWLAYKLFGIDNDTAKLERYEKAMEVYLQEAFQWELDVNEKENEAIEENGETRDVRYAEFRQARAEHDGFIRSLDTFLSNPMNKFSVFSKDTEKLIWENHFWTDEKSSVSANHKLTARGKARELLINLNEKMGYNERTDVYLHNWWGHDADPTKLLAYYDFRLDNLQVKPLELPKKAGFDRMNETEQADHNKYMSNLFDLSCLAVLLDPDVTGKNPKNGRTPIEEAQNRFDHIFNDMIVSGRPNSVEYFVFIDPAREKVMPAMEAYAKGEKDQLAGILREGMRRMLTSGHNIKKFTDYALNTCYVIGKMHDLLQQDPDLLQATGLTEEEMQDARAHMQLHKFMRQGLQAKKDILDHAFNNRTLTPEELKKAAGDVLLFHHITLGVEDGYNKNEAIICESTEYKKYESMMYVHKVVNGVPQFDKDGKPKMEPADAATSTWASRQLEALTGAPPANEFTMGLLNNDGVAQYMQGILEKANFNKIGEMSRDQLKELFGKSDAEILSVLMPPKPEAVPEQDNPTVNKELSTQQQKEHSAPGLKG